MGMDEMTREEMKTAKHVSSSFLCEICMDAGLVPGVDFKEMTNGFAVIGHEILGQKVGHDGRGWYETARIRAAISEAAA